MPHASTCRRPEGVRFCALLLLAIAASTSAGAAASASHEHAQQGSKDAVMVVVGSAGCGDTALLEADCSYTLLQAPTSQGDSSRLSRGAWVPGPLHSRQQVPVTLPACTHSSNAHGGAKTVFVLQRTGELHDQQQLCCTPAAAAPEQAP
jgi:hypothetical protein